jgi:predicted neuraminidase
MHRLAAFVLIVPISLSAGALVQAPREAVVRTEFIYDTGPSPSVHASTLVETTSGQLVAAWFGGTAEGNDDVSIWLARHEGGRWSPGVKVADGSNQNASKRYPTWNPVLFQPKDGPLLLFYKVGPSPSEWWGMVMSSTDDGRTWSKASRLPDGILGPIKNKPVQLADGTIVSGSSTEDAKSDAWRVHVELSRDQGRTWQLAAPIGDGGFNAIQPGILRHADGRLQMLCRSKEMEVPTTWSSDGGRTWGPLAKSGLYAVNSGLDAVTLQDGRHVLVYNYRDRPGGGPDGYQPETSGLANAPTAVRARWPLVVSVSRDGVAWTKAIALDDKPIRHGYAYPAVIQTRDGKIHVTYTFNREKIKHVVVDPAKL